MSRILRLRLRYDGTGFCGWQVQPDRRTVQGELMRAAAEILGGPVKCVGAGRTDAGVHALGQVASLATEHTLPAEGFRRGLNSLLPPDIHVDRAEEAPDGFHARFSALSRTYRYQIRRREGPIRRRYAWILAEAPAAAPLAAAAGALLGKHDFAPFAGGEAPAGDTWCRVLSVRCRERGDRLAFEITADRFVHRMVRQIVGTLVVLSRRGDLSEEVVAGILRGESRRPLFPPAPACGLFFLRADYPPDDQIRPYRG